MVRDRPSGPIPSGVAWVSTTLPAPSPSVMCMTIVRLSGQVNSARTGTPLLVDSTCVATVFCDDNKKYLSTDLCSDEECKEHYRCNDVELIDFRVIPACASGVPSRP